jgi:uroporphyrinogen decarboxylase
MARYIQYQADNGAQAVQIFDSWATELSPVDFEQFSLPYLKQIIDTELFKIHWTKLCSP